jgi:hypothetical protein
MLIFTTLTICEVFGAEKVWPQHHINRVCFEALTESQTENEPECVKLGKII